MNGFKPLGFKKEKMLESMNQNNLSVVLLSSPENIFYATGYTGLPSSGNPILYTLRSRLPYLSFIDNADGVTLICWSFSVEGVEFGADRVIGITNFNDAQKCIERELKSKLKGKDTIGIESSCPYYITQIIQNNIGQVKISIVDSILNQMRLIKSEEEIKRLKKNTEIVEKTVLELYDVLYIGMSRLELISKAKSRLIRNGAMGISHVTISFGEANPEIAIDEELHKDRLVTLDLGGIVDGYTSDNRRYAYTGRVPDEITEQYSIMTSIVDKVGAALVPGKSYSDVFKVALDLYKKYNKVELLSPMSRVGHNIGLETEEEWIDNNSEKRVKEGMVINIELYTKTSQGFHIGNEETYVIRKDGSKQISSLPRKIRVIE